MGAQRVARRSGSGPGAEHRGLGGPGEQRATFEVWRPPPTSTVDCPPATVATIGGALAMSFPALEAAQAELRTIFNEAGPDLDLRQVKSLPDGVTAGDVSAIGKHIKKLNDDIEALKGVQDAADRAYGNESGDGARPFASRP